MLFLTRTTFNMQSFIGCIMLAGIVVNNAILLVDTANLLRSEGLPLDRAIREAGTRRLRPILMTTLTTVLGLLPLALGLGDGGETQAPMARAVIGGLSSSTLITLFFIPAAYSVAESMFGAGRKSGKPELLPEENKSVQLGRRIGEKAVPGGTSPRGSGEGGGKTIPLPLPAPQKTFSD